MITPGTLYRFRRNDLIAACERMSQQAQPKAFRRLTKDELRAEVLWVAERDEGFGREVLAMAERLEVPRGVSHALLRRAA